MKKIFMAAPAIQGPGGAWTFLKIPFNVEKVWGVKGRLAVKGKVNGFSFRNSIFPNGKGSHSMMFSKALQEGAKAKPGQVVRVEMEPDTQKKNCPSSRRFKKGDDGRTGGPGILQPPGSFAPEGLCGLDFIGQAF